jgi:hypothetical protein
MLPSSSRRPFFVTAQVQAQAVWQAQSIYQIITDQFYDGDPSNDNADGNYDPSGHTGTSVHVRRFCISLAMSAGARYIA